MARKHIFCEKTELVLIILMGNGAFSMNLTYDQIVRIQFEPCTERKFLFFKSPSEKIVFVTRKNERPVEFLKSKEKEFFEEYKVELEKFAKNNRISFTNNLVSDTASGSAIDA